MMRQVEWPRGGLLGLPDLGWSQVDAADEVLDRWRDWSVVTRFTSSRSRNCFGRLAGALSGRAGARRLRRPASRQRGTLWPCQGW